MKFKPYNKFVIRRPILDYETNSSLTDHMLNKMAHDVVLKESIYYASPELYYELEKWLVSGKIKSSDKRILDTIYKYASRMMYRATPFGLFSACGVGTYGDQMFIPSGANVFKAFKYDGHLTYNVAKSILKNDLTRYKSILLKSNETIYKVGKYYYLWSRTISGTIEIIKIPVTELLTTCINLSLTPTSLSDLIKQITDDYEIEENDITGYITNLCHKGVLIDNITPETVGSDNLLRLETVYDDSKNSFVGKLKNNLNLISESESFANRLNLIESVKKLIRNNGISVKPNNIIQVDSFLKDSAIIPISVRKSVQDIFNLYQAISPAIPNALASFIKRYQDRYELQSVSVLEALNPVCGIGYNNVSEMSNLIKTVLNKPKKKEPINQQLKVTLTLLEQVVLKKIISIGDLLIHKLIITNKDLKPYINEYPSDFPMSFSSIFKIVGYDDNGPIISGVSFSGPTATSLLTRFANGNSHIEKIVKDIANTEQESMKDVILAEISHLTYPHSENIQSRPNMRSAIIPISSLNQGNTECVIDISDLYIRIIGNKLHLFSRKLNKEVLPCFSSAFNYKYNTSDIYKFLGDIQHQNRNRTFSPSFNGLIKLFKHVPRVQYRNIIITPEKWFISKDEISINGKFSIDKFKELHSAKQMPRFVFFAQGDNTFVIDINQERSIGILGKLISTASTIILEEFLPQSPDISHYSSVIEIIQPFVPDI